MQAAYLEDDDEEEEEEQEDNDDEFGEDQIDVDGQQQFAENYYGNEYRLGNFPGFQAEEDDGPNDDPTIYDRPEKDYEGNDDFLGDEENYV